MFVKLLRHEWRSCRQMIRILCAIILLSGTAIGGSGFYLAWAGDQRLAGNDSILTLLAVLLLIAACIAIGVCCVCGVFYLIWRYYQSRFTDEGYLTFTLPVTHHQLLLSSLLNTLRGSLYIFLAAIAAGCIAPALLLLAFRQEIIWADTFYAIRHFLPRLLNSLFSYRKWLLLFAGSALSAFLGSILTLMLSVTIGSLLARKHKILCSVAIYYGLGFLQSLIFNFVAFANMNSPDATWFLTTPLWEGILTSVLSYFLIHWLTSRKLNLN